MLLRIIIVRDAYPCFIVLIQRSIRRRIDRRIELRQIWISDFDFEKSIIGRDGGLFVESRGAAYRIAIGNYNLKACWNKLKKGPRLCNGRGSDGFAISWCNDAHGVSSLKRLAFSRTTTRSPALPSSQSRNDCLPNYWITESKTMERKRRRSEIKTKRKTDKILIARGKRGSFGDSKLDRTGRDKRRSRRKRERSIDLKMSRSILACDNADGRFRSPSYRNTGQYLFALPDTRYGNPLIGYRRFPRMIMRMNHPNAGSSVKQWTITIYRKQLQNRNFICLHLRATRTAIILVGAIVFTSVARNHASIYSFARQLVNKVKPWISHVSTICDKRESPERDFIGE